MFLVLIMIWAFFYFLSMSMLSPSTCDDLVVSNTQLWLRFSGHRFYAIYSLKKTECWKNFMKQAEHAHCRHALGANLVVSFRTSTKCVSNALFIFYFFYSGTWQRKCWLVNWMKIRKLLQMPE